VEVDEVVVADRVATAALEELRRQLLLDQLDTGCDQHVDDPGLGGLHH